MPDGSQHTVYVLAAAQAARDGALGAQGVHWGVAVAAVGTIALGVVRELDGDEVPDNEAAPQEVSDEWAHTAVAHRHGKELRVVVEPTRVGIMENAAIDLAVNMQSGMDKRVAVASAHRVRRNGVMFFAELDVVFLPEELVAVMKVVEEHILQR